MTQILPVGKIPPRLLVDLLAELPVDDPRVLVGPGIGLDCAVVDIGELLLVFKSDPITFAADEIGWYAVQVNANDIATTGATPRWFLSTLLLPQGSTTPQQVHQINAQICMACRELGISVIGGHTEITYGLDRPILVGTMIGEVNRDALVTPMGIEPGDQLLLTKGVPIEATAILARDLSDRLGGDITNEQLELARCFLYNPGISVVQDARIALGAGAVHAMHDPTEGGLYAGLWEMAQASGHSLCIDPQAVPIPAISRCVLRTLCEQGFDPLAAIASGALLLAVPPQAVTPIQRELKHAGIECALIGSVLTKQGRTPLQERTPSVWQVGPTGHTLLPRPERDELAKLFD